MIKGELFELAVSGNFEVITSGIADVGPREVVVRESDPNAVNDDEMDSLGLASFGGQLDVVEVLVELLERAASER